MFGFHFHINKSCINHCPFGSLVWLSHFNTWLVSWKGLSSHLLNHLYLWCYNCVCFEGKLKSIPNKIPFLENYSFFFFSLCLVLIRKTVCFGRQAHKIERLQFLLYNKGSCLPFPLIRSPNTRNRKTFFKISFSLKTNTLSNFLLWLLGEWCYFNFTLFF